VLDDLAEEAGAQGVILQRAALTSIDEMADPARAARGARGRGYRRCAGQFPVAPRDREAGLRNLFALADRTALRSTSTSMRGSTPRSTGWS
jgi:hypothetical protein